MISKPKSEDWTSHVLRFVISVGAIVAATVIIHLIGF